MRKGTIKHKYQYPHMEIGENMLNVYWTNNNFTLLINEIFRNPYFKTFRHTTMMST